MGFAPFCAPFAGKNMLIFANICKNTCCKSVVQPFINQGKSRKKANDKSTIHLPRREIRIAKEAKDDFMERGVGNEEDENA